MSIAPPTDIVVDVAQAADPQRLQVATQKLNALAAEAGGSAADFSTLLDETAAAARRPAAARAAASTLMPSTPSATPSSSTPYRKFEAVLLQTMLQEILPKDDALFGDASSADICRSMLAEQLATQLSKSGAFGIARMMEKAQASRQPAAPAGAPQTGST